MLTGSNLLQHVKPKEAQKSKKVIPFESSTLILRWATFHSSFPFFKLPLLRHLSDTHQDAPTEFNSQRILTIYSKFCVCVFWFIRAEISGKGVYIYLKKSNGFVLNLISSNKTRILELSPSSPPKLFETLRKTKEGRRVMQFVVGNSDRDTSKNWCCEAFSIPQCVAGVGSTETASVTMNPPVFYFIFFRMMSWWSFFIVCFKERKSFDFNIPTWSHSLKP